MLSGKHSFQNFNKTKFLMLNDRMCTVHVKFVHIYILHLVKHISARKWNKKRSANFNNAMQLSYHRRHKMISEELELYVEGGRVSHSWHMCVVGHARGGMGGSRDAGGWYVCGTKLVECRKMPKHLPSAR